MEQEMLFSFDDGPGPHTNSILDLAKKYEIIKNCPIFFCLSLDLFFIFLVILFLQIYSLRKI